MKNIKISAKLPKLLVIGLSLPGGNDGGGVVRGEILRRYPDDRYVCISMNLPDGSAHNKFLESNRYIDSLIAPLIPSFSVRAIRPLMVILRAFGSYCMAPYRIHQAVKFGIFHKVNLVWAELHGDSVIIAEKVAQKIGVPFVGTVWDDLEAWISDYNYDWFSKKLIRQRFRQSLINACHLSTAGEVMQRIYREEYGVKSVILRHGFNSPAFPSNLFKKEDEIIIGFAGNSYCRENWSAFLSAVALLNRKGILPDIKLRIFGRVNLHDVPDDVKIENNGWQPAEKALKGIAETDFCYLEHWFDLHKRRHAELSFPNKFESYMAAGRPVFFHGPEYAGIAETISKYKVGLCVHSLIVDEIAAALEEMIVNTTLRKQFEKAAIDAFHKEFNADVMVKNFYTMIGIDFASTLHQKGMNDKQRPVRI